MSTTKRKPFSLFSFEQSEGQQASEEAFLSSPSTERATKPFSLFLRAGANSGAIFFPSGSLSLPLCFLLFFSLLFPLFRSFSPHQSHFVKSSNVRDGNVAEHARKQIGPLVGDRRDQRASKARAVDRQLCGRSVPGLHQILGAAHEIIVGVLLVGHDAVGVPALAVLSATAHAARGVDGAKRLRRDEHVGLELDAVDDVEPSVAVEHRWVIAIEFDPLFSGDKQGDVCPAVCRGNKYLHCRER